MTGRTAPAAPHDQRTTGQCLVGWPVWVCAVGVLPYVTLKVAWLAQLGWGVRDRAIITDTTFVLANAITLLLDLVVLAMVLTLAHRPATRSTGRLVSLLAWAATGMLVGAVLGLLHAGVAALILPEQTTPNGLAPWVYAVVYGGFTAQAVAVVAVVVPRYALIPPAKPNTPRARVTQAGGMTCAVAGALLVAATALSPALTTGADLDPRIRLALGLHATVLLITAASSVWHWPSAPGPPSWASRMAFVGTGVALTWGLYDLALSATVLHHDPPLIGTQAVRVVSAAILTTLLLTSFPRPSPTSGNHGHVHRNSEPTPPAPVVEQATTTALLSGNHRRTHETTANCVDLSATSPPPTTRRRPLESSGPDT